MELGTLTPDGDAAPTSGSAPPAAVPRRTVTRARSLPGGRAVIGALLVAAAAVGIFAAYLQATAAPATSYLVANRTIEPGTRFADLDDVTAAVGRAAIDLPPPTAARVFPLEDLERLVGHVVVAPIERGELLTRSAVVPGGGVADDHTLSFAVPAADAVAGRLRPGERIDVVATHGAGTDTATELVVRGIQLVAVEAIDGGVGTGSLQTLTVAVPAVEDVLALSHAVATAELRVVRSTAEDASDATSMPAYRPSTVAEAPGSEATAGEPGSEATAGEPGSEATAGAPGSEATEKEDRP